MENETKPEIHSHLRARMLQRGVSEEEIERTLKEGWPAKDAKEGTFGKMMIFPFAQEWEGKYYAQKEVVVYYKFLDEKLLVLTVKARYGNQFGKGE